jgi:hypothetical protein
LEFYSQSSWWQRAGLWPCGASVEEQDIKRTARDFGDFIGSLGQFTRVQEIGDYDMNVFALCGKLFKGTGSSSTANEGKHLVLRIGRLW